MASANTIYGLFPGPDSADRGVRALRAAGVSQEKILVMASEPHEEYSFTQAEHKTIMPWLAVCGGLVGGTCGYLLARFTQVAYPIAVGNMPAVSPWPTAIVTYELTMFGAVITTVITLIITARLGRKRPVPYDEAVSHGKILIGVVDPSDNAREAVENSLRQAGAEEIKRTS
jgi:hypothetical protein